MFGNYTNKSIIENIAALFVAGMLLYVSLPNILFAEDFSSSNFILRNPIFATFGTANATSTNFRITASGGQIGPGEASSTSFINESGFQYFDEYDPRQLNWRWYDDEGNETPTTPLAGEVVAPTNIDDDEVIKLRVTIDNLSGVSGKDIKLRLEYSEYADFSQATSTVTEIENCIGNSLWCYGDGVDSDSDPVSALLLSDSNATGTHNESGTSTSAFDPPDGNATEFEFTLKQDGARVNTTYYFRVTIASTSEPVLLGEGESIPSLSTAGASLSLTIGGLSSGTVTEGVTTDVTTTAQSVPFGELSFDTETEAGQRVTVSTNATNGYQIFAFGRQELLHTGYGNEIGAVSGTNDTPSTWASGCPGAAIGCYGYHPGDDTLSGGSTRFLTDNTYAQFETQPREIAYSSLPVQNEITDVIYKIEVRDAQQGGQYQSNVAYIVVASF